MESPAGPRAPFALRAKCWAAEVGELFRLNALGLATAGLEREAAAQAERELGPRGRDLVAIVGLVLEDLAELDRIRRDQRHGFLWLAIAELASRRAHRWLAETRAGYTSSWLDLDWAIAKGKARRRQLRLVIEKGRGG